MTRFALLLALLSGCTDSTSTRHQYVLSGDTCAIHETKDTCIADSDCLWAAIAAPCSAMAGVTCPSGSCYSMTGGGSGSGGSGSGGWGSGSGSSGSGTTGSGSGGGGGSGSGSAACVCPGGAVCVEQIGGPAVPSGSSEDISCVVPSPGTGDACARIEGQGSCSPSASVYGLCVCDNGVR